MLGLSLKERSARNPPTLRVAVGFGIPPFRNAGPMRSIVRRPTRSV